MDSAIIGVVAAAAAVPLTILFGLPVVRRPRVRCEPVGACLYRCLTEPVFKEGWGIIETQGKLRVSHKPITIVDAKLSYLMDKKYTVGKQCKGMGNTFPPVHFFVRVSNDEAGSIGAMSRQGFTSIELSPGGGEKPFNIRFALAGHFATEFSQLFFDRTLSTVSGMFVPMHIRFQYEHNGQFYWTKDFDISCHPYFNMGWTSTGPAYIHEDGTAAAVMQSDAVNIE